MSVELDIPRRECDTRKSYPALCDYLRMGVGRSIAKLHARYLKHASSEDQANPPTQKISTLHTWSAKYHWQERAVEYDQRVQEWQEEQVKQGMREGLALDHYRVEELKGIFDRLKRELEANDALWLEDKKQLGKGEQMEIIDIVRYNTSLINDLRGVLDDLAQETGGRIRRTDVTSKGQQVGTQKIVIGEKEIEF